MIAPFPLPYLEASLILYGCEIGRTPITFEAFQLFALPLLLTLQKFVEDLTLTAVTPKKPQLFLRRSRGWF